MQRAARAIVALASLAAAFGCGRAPPPASPNLLLIGLDTVRADHTSVHGYALDTTPRLAALARDGVRFEVAYAPSATTGPTHASLFTGRDPLAHGVVKNGLPLDDRFPTLAEAFAAAGYQTAGFVSSYVLSRRFGYARGFERYDDELPAETAKVKSAPDLPAGQALDRRGAATTARARAWLERERDAARPFLLFVHYFDPHNPYRVGPAHRRRFPPRADLEPPFRVTVPRYDAEIAYVDDRVGELLDALDAAGLAAHTLVVVTADHGEGLGDHGTAYHGASLHEELVRVPLVLRWPGELPAGRAVDEPVSLLDLAATLCELALGTVPPAFAQGHSLAAVLRAGEPPDPERPIRLLRRDYERRALGGRIVDGIGLGLRSGRWKYVEMPAEGTRALFDLESDPGETRDVAADHPDVAAELAARVAAWRAEAGERPAPAVDDATRRALEALGYVQ